MPEADDHAPPWIAFPGRPQSSLGWRMGNGDAWLTAWLAWWRGDLSSDDQRAFAAQWPEPEGWIGFYASLDVVPRDRR